MSSVFDQVIERKGSGCFKYDALLPLYGRDDLLALWVADMDFAIAPAIQEALSKRLSHPVFGYNFRLDSYYDAVINWAQRRYHWTIHRDWLISTPGIVPAINLAVLTLTEPGDGVLIQTPVYGPFHHAATNHGRKLLCNRLIPAASGYQIDFQEFDRLAGQAKLFILCNPHNPVGRAFTEDELRKMGEICRKHGVTVFSDEIHADIVYDGHKHIPIASVDDLSSICISSFSPAKSFNLAGLATAVTVCSNPKLFKPLNDLNEKLHLFIGNSFGISALTAAYTRAEDWLDQLVVYLAQNRNFIDKCLRDSLPMVKSQLPEASYLSWLDFTDLGLDSETLWDLLVNKARLALDPGSKYGTGFEQFYRLNFACPRSRIVDAMDRIITEIGKLS
ncbi:MAG TPA: PatB family C-S lyase [Candidatus Cloacimonadota bacterium]|nr:PatB family C-S lyase [Candidatus Cloacimonadota bacterium]